VKCITKRQCRKCVCPVQPGLMYDKRQGLPQDYAEAAKWYQKAAEQGFAEAQTTSA